MSIYASTRALFEVLMYRMIDKIKSGQDYEKELTTLIGCYNDASETCESLLERLQKIERMVTCVNF